MTGWTKAEPEGLRQTIRDAITQGKAGEMTSTERAGSPGSEIAYPEVQMHVVRPTEPVTGRVVRNELCVGRKAASFVRHVEIDVSGTPLEKSFRAGQSFGVIAPGEDAKGKPHKVRLYSIAAPTAGEDGNGCVLSTTVKRVLDENWEDHKLFLGVASNYICDCQEGDEILVSGPNGKRFLIPAKPEDHDYVFIATGTGIAPFRGMLLDLLNSGCQSRIVLIMGVPYATDLIYDDFFRDLESKHTNFTYVTALSRHNQPDGKGPMYVQGRLETDRELLAPILRSDRALVYACGLAGMELGIFQEMARLLEGEDLEQYLQCDADALADVASWTRKMIHKQVKPTRRVFLEVY